MNPYQLVQSEPRVHIPPSRLELIHRRLTKMLNVLGDDEPVYVNGLTFTADELRCVLTKVSLK